MRAQGDRAEYVTGTTPWRAICPLREEGVAGMDGGCRGRLPAAALCLNRKEQLVPHQLARDERE